MTRRKKRARTRQVERTPTIDMSPDEPERYDIPAPFPLLEIEGPSAKELAAYGSTFLTQALLVKNIGDAPALANRDDVMPAEVFGMRELMMGLALVGTGVPARYCLDVVVLSRYRKMRETGLRRAIRRETHGSSLGGLFPRFHVQCAGTHTGDE